MRRWVCRLQLLLALASGVILGSDFHFTHDHILLSQILDSPNQEGHVPVYISPRSRLTQIYTQVLGSLFVASYDSQSYGGGIRTRLHTGYNGLTHSQGEIYVTTDGQSARLSWIKHPSGA
jgi:hypothetical protein